MQSYDYHRQAKIDKAIDKTGGVYPGGNGEDYLHSGLPGVGYIASRWARTTSAEFVCTRAEFEARKAERQGKPSWDDAPAKASWLAQDLSGAWFFFDEKPGVIPGIWIGGNAVKQSIGEVIGDWHSTLEQRPNHIGESDEKGVLNFDLEMDIAKTSPALALHLAKEKLEAYQDSRAKPDNSADWYDYDKQEVIEKPPIGAECIVLGNVHARIIGSTASGYLIYQSVETGFCEMACQPASFRPLDWNRNQQPNPEPETSPELSFHLSNAFNELQASARLLPDSDPRRAQLVALAGGVSAVKEVV